jgi:protein SCO1/2
MRARLALGVVVVVTAAGCGGGSKQAAPGAMAPAFRGTELTGGAPSPDFALHDQNGKLVRLSALRGKAVLVTFLYTHCPDVCPIIAANLDIALRRLGAARDGVRVLAVSVDPARDTPAAARAFVRSHALVPQFRFLVGTRRELARVWRGYHIAVQPGPKGTVSHSAYTLLVDRRGRQRVLYDAQVKPAAVLHDLRALGG